MPGGLIGLKIALLAAILATGWIGGLVPLARGKRRGGERFLSWGSAFAAGIFLGTGLILMLGEADRQWQALGWDYPIALVLAAVGFAAILLLEHVLLPEPVHEIVHTHAAEGHAHGPHHGEPGGHGHGRRTGVDPVSAYPYFLIAALSIHSLIAGVALGAQDGFRGIVALFLALVAHKMTEGFALGISLARADIGSRRAHGLLALFAGMTPLGIAVGLAASELLRGGPERLVDAIFLALAAGTFIYIASLDILQDEFLRPGSRFVKWLFAVAGLTVTALLALWV